MFLARHDFDSDGFLSFHEFENAISPVSKDYDELLARRAPRDLTAVRRYLEAAFSTELRL
jgi:hypothetical protein